MNSKFKKIVRTSLISLTAASALLANQAEAKHHGNTTPTKYLVTISQIAFHKVGDPANNFINYATGTGQFDIASVQSNSNIGILAATGTLPVGTYDQVRFTVSKTMTVKASNPSLSDGHPCRTDSSATVITNPFGDNSVDTAYLGNRDGGAAQNETVVVPRGSRVHNNSDTTDLGSSFQGVLPVNISVNTSAPNITIKFDVTNAVDFEAINPSECIVFPDGPSVTVTSS